MSDLGRLERELRHDRAIAADAERIWNWDSPAGRRRALRRARMYIEHAGLCPGRRGLELGCGTGLFLAQAATSGAELVGVDLSPDLLEKARRRLTGRSNVRLARVDAHRLPFPEASFDAVYGSSILHHLEVPAALAEARRVLRPGGRIAFTEPNLLNPQVAYMYRVGPRERFGLSPDEMAFTARQARRVLEGLGYRDVRVLHFDFLHPSVPGVLVPAVARVGQWLEALPGLRAIAGSLLLRATRP